MAKIGTAHIEIKPVLDREALSTITALIEEAVATGVLRGMAAASAKPPRSHDVQVWNPDEQGLHRH